MSEIHLAFKHVAAEKSTSYTDIYLYVCVCFYVYMYASIYLSIYRCAHDLQSSSLSFSRILQIAAARGHVDAMAVLVGRIGDTDVDRLGRSGMSTSGKE